MAVIFPFGDLIVRLSDAMSTFARKINEKKSIFINKMLFGDNLQAIKLKQAKAYYGISPYLYITGIFSP